MSQEMMRLIQIFNDDADVQGRFKEVKGTDAFADLAVTVAEEHGFTVSREEVKTFGATGGKMSESELETVVGGLSDALSSMSDMSSSQQMQLQYYMDAYSMCAQMVSNVQQKSSNTSSTIVGNLK